MHSGIFIIVPFCEHCVKLAAASWQWLRSTNCSTCLQLQTRWRLKIYKDQPRRRRISYVISPVHISYIAVRHCVHKIR